LIEKAAEIILKQSDWLS